MHEGPLRPVFQFPTLLILPSVPGGIPLRYAAPRLSKKWLAPLFRGFHSSLAPTARPGSYAGKPLLRKAFCGFAVHAAKSDESLKGLRSSIRQRFLDKLRAAYPFGMPPLLLPRVPPPCPGRPGRPSFPGGRRRFAASGRKTGPLPGFPPAAGGWAKPTRRRPPAGPVAPCPFAAAPPAKPTFFENPIDRSG